MWWCVMAADFAAEVAATLSRWEHVEECSLDSLLLGLSEEVGIRRSAEYWTRDRKGWTHHAAGLKLRHCLADLADICTMHSVVEVFASRPAPGSADLSIWYRMLEPSRTLHARVPAVSA